MTALRPCPGVQHPVMPQVCPRAPLRQRLMGHSTGAGSQQSLQPTFMAMKLPPLWSKRCPSSRWERGAAWRTSHSIFPSLNTGIWVIILTGIYSFFGGLTDIFPSFLQLLVKTDRVLKEKTALPARLSSSLVMYSNQLNNRWILHENSCSCIHK